MSLASTNNRNDYAGNGTTATYNYTFKIFNESDIKLIIRDTATDIETELTIATDYTVTGVTDESGGNIILVDAGQAWIDGSSFLDTGYDLAMRRVIDLKQTTDIRNQGDFYPEIHEDQFDKLVMIDQQQQDAIDRSVRLPESVPASDFDTTIPAEMVGTNSLALVSNVAGDGFAVGPSAGAISGANAAAIAAAASAAAALVSEGLADTDATATAADVVSTNADVVSTGIDATATAADVVTTNADVVLTNADVVTAAASESAAALSASNAAASAAASSWQDVVFKTFADTPVAVTDSENGYLYIVDCSGGNVVINLPSVAALTLTAPWRVGFKKSDTSANTITINRDGTDTIDGATSVVISRAEAGVSLIPDTDPIPDEWTSLTFGEVPIDGAIVGDTDTQDLSNKTFIDAITVAEIATPSTPAAGERKIYPKNDGLFYQLNDAGDETEMGAGGGGSLDFFYTENFEKTVATDLQKTGTLTVADNVTTQISGDSSIKVTQASGSLGATLKSPSSAIVLDINQKGVLLSFQGRYLYDGDYDDYQLVAYDETNSAELGRVSLKSVSEAETFRLLFNTLTTTNEISYYFEVMTENIGAILEFDNIEARVNPLPTAESAESQNIRFEGNASTMTSAVSGTLRFGTLTENTGLTLISYNNTDGFFTASADINITASLSANSAGTTEISIERSDSSKVYSISHTGVTEDTAVSAPIKLKSGEKIKFATNGTLTAARLVLMNITATATSANVVFEGASSKLDASPYTPSITGVGTPTNVDFLYNEGSDFLNIRGIFTTGTVTGDELRIDLPPGFTTPADIIGSIEVVGGFRRGSNWVDYNTNVNIEPSKTYMTLSFSSTVASYSTNLAGSGVGSSQNIIIWARVPVQEIKASDIIYSVPVTNEVENVYSGTVLGGVSGAINDYGEGVSFFTFKTHSGPGNDIYSLNTSIFTEFPKLGATVNDSDSSNPDTTIIIRKGTFPDFTVVRFSTTSVLVDSGFELWAKKSGSDYIPPKGYFLGNIPKVVHSNSETWTGERWIDGRKIWMRSYVTTSNLSSGTTIATIDTGLIIIDAAKNAADRYILPTGHYMLQGANYIYADYVPSTGVLAYKINGETLYSGSTLIIKYVK